MNTREAGPDTKAVSIDAYLVGLPEDARAALARARRTVMEAAPGAVEGLSYGMPGYKYKGRPLVYFAAWKNHLALYALSADRFRDELAAFEVEKGTIRFRPDKPLPEPLLKAMLAARVADIEAAEAERKERRKAGAKSR